MAASKISAGIGKLYLENDFSNLSREFEHLGIFANVKLKP
jgi:hypothetical protein